LALERVWIGNNEIASMEYVTKGTRNRWIVFIFAGRDSLHQKWTEDYRQFGFDLCLLQYDTEMDFDDPNSKNATYIVKRKGLRFKLLSHFMKDHPEVLDAYEHYFVMDDDVETSPSDIRRLLSICRKHHFDLAQPALDHGSHAAFEYNRKVDKSLFRLTSTVEIGLPVFSRRAFLHFQEDLHFLPVGIGWGVDSIWGIKWHAGKGKSIWGGKIGVIDDVHFKHAKPFGRSDSVYNAEGADAWHDAMSLKQKYKMEFNPFSPPIEVVDLQPIKTPKSKK
jgi:hypothetical protein